jgi:uncharacterized GH25 family protein
MTRFLMAALGACIAAATANAHFVFLLPDAANPGKLVAVFSDGAGPDEKVKKETFDLVEAGTFYVSPADGKPAALKGTRAGNSLKFDLPAGSGLVTGNVVYGVFQRGEAKPQLLSYYAKAALSPAAAAKPLGGAPVELCAETAAGKTRLRLLADGKPLAGAEVSVAAAGEKEFVKVKTDADGYTEGFPGTGRFIAYAKHSGTATGEHAGKKYEGLMNYATLVVDVK